jgi:hypothetical protein
LIVVPKPMPAAPLRHLIVVPVPLSAAPLVVRRRYLFGRGAQAVARGAACCWSQVLDRCAQAVACGPARCASQVRDRGVQAKARGAATLMQHEKNSWADVQRSRVNITGFIYTVAR